MKKSIRKILWKVNRFFLFFGLDIKTLISNFSGLFWFISNLFSFVYRRGSIKNVRLNPQLLDRNKEAGDIYSHYFWQDLIVAKYIIEKSPLEHFDIGSRIDGFIAHLLSAGTKVFVFDIRPLKINILNLHFKVLNFSLELPSDLENACCSLSCLHTLEHFGLGRYGDPIDVDGHIKGVIQISRLIKSEGYFYLSFPVGKEKIYFNAHRVIDPALFFKENLTHLFYFDKFILIDECCKINELNLTDFLNYKFSIHSYSCGIFILRKK